MNKTARLLSAAAAGVLVITGCGSSSTDSPLADFNDADVMFAQMMIPHHEQAIEMSDIALDPAVGASDAVKQLASKVKEAQDPEIDQMTALLTAWGEPTSMDSSVDHSTMMSGMLTLDQLATLSQTRGAEFDRAWLEAMIAHHEGAIDMAEELLADGVNAEARELAEQVVAGQRAEIDEMRELLG